MKSTMLIDELENSSYQGERILALARGSREYHVADSYRVVGDSETACDLERQLRGKREAVGLWFR